MLMYAAIVALAAFLFMGGKKTAAETGAVQEDLKRLYATNPEAYQAVVALLGGGDPNVMVQYAAQLLSEYPALAKSLGEMAAEQLKRQQAAPQNVTGKSGTTWQVVWVKRIGDKVWVDIFYQGNRIFRYTQIGSDKTSRVYIGSPPGVPSATLARARTDFGV